MKAVLLSIQPKYCELIASGKKTIEVRKTRPKIETPFKCYIYCTIGNGVKGDYLVPSGIQCGKVIGEFVCDLVEEFTQAFFDEQEPSDTEEIGFYLDQFNMAYNELCSYVGLKDFYGWHITDLKIYDKPKELGEYGEFYIWKKCNSCRDTGYESTACCFDIDCKVAMVICRPPQSWQYVESLGE